MAGNQKDVRRPEDWFPPVRFIDSASTADVDAAVAAALVPVEAKILSRAKARFLYGG